MTESAPRVLLLDPLTVNQIAAGEVVERPASVVKELVENAIDAGARRIEVELRDSGKALIRVSDDGCGMSPEDAETSLQRHATSKISSSDDLQHVLSLGFRGEALPSIASVCRMTLSTGVEDGLRTVIRVDGGEILPAERHSGPKGTEITVEDLFFNTPARLKFLKSDTTELGGCVETVSRYALGYPGIAFTFIHNGGIAMRTTGSGDPLEAIADVWGRDIARSLAEIRTNVAGIELHGFISPPHVTKPTRSMQYLWVNSRPVRTRTLTASLDQAYRDITPERRFPIVALMMDVDPARVDVNVSPTKSEVKFQNEGQAFDALRLGIKQALLEHGMMPSAEGVAAANEALSAAQGFGPGAPGFGAGGSGLGSSGLLFNPFALSTSANVDGTSFLLDPRPETRDPLSEMSQAAQSPLPQGASNERYPFAELLEGLKVIGQSMDTFIIAETTRGIVIIDQHVAHERILYEYLCGLKGASAIEKQSLLTPLTLELDRRSAVLLRERLDEVRAVGFELEPFGGESYLVRAAPAALRGKDPINVLKDLVDELLEVSVTRRLVPTREQIWITSACKMAVKAGDPLSHAEMEKLIVDLASTENPYLCPHGRPITITLTRQELFRKFQR